MGLPQASVSIPDYIDRKTQAPAIEDATLFTGAASTWPRAASPSRSARWRSRRRSSRRCSAAVPRPRVHRRRGEAGRRQATSSSRTGLERRASAAIASIVGRDIRINGEAYSVVGVLPADFELPSRDVALLVPFAFTPQQMSDQGRGNEFSSMIARLRPGATIEQLNAQMKTIVDRNLERLPQFGLRADQRLRRLRRRRSASSSSATRARRCSSCRRVSRSCCSSPAPTSPTCC